MQATVIEMVARDWKVWMASRPFVGFGFGFACTALVIYNSEIAPVKLRGFLLSTWALGFAFGQFMASVALEIIASVCNTHKELNGHFLTTCLVILPHQVLKGYLFGVGPYWNILHLPAVPPGDSLALCAYGPARQRQEVATDNEWEHRRIRCRSRM